MWPAFLTRWHRTKWGGRRHCWGPRYAGWRNVVDRLSPIETNATLWAKCVDAVLDEKGLLSESSSYLEVRYESFVQHPAIELPRICSFLDLTDNFDFSTGIDLIESTNFNKWQSAMTREMKLVIGPILGPTLTRSGYEEDESWCSL